MPEALRIGIAGLGTVGGGLVRLLQKNGAQIAARAGRPIEITHVNARDKAKDRGVDLSAYQWVDNPLELADKGGPDIVVELIGGSEGVAKELVEKSLSAGKHVVTANKALLAHHGMALAALAEETGACLNYEAAAAGGIPIIKSLREGFAANNIESLYGILNGTCNYILTQMRESGRAFEDVLREAQEKGYAEADPSFDIDGVDTAHKLCLLTALAYGVRPDIEALKITGIRKISALDISFVEELGYRVKLLGIAQRLNGKIMQTVEPCLVPRKNSLAFVGGVFNAVFTKGDFAGASMVTGRGAGAGPTASSVAADLIDLARGIHLPVFGVSSGALQKAEWVEEKDIVNCYYLHFYVHDKPGVIADLSAILKKYDISIERFIQPGQGEASVSIVMVTHETDKASMRRAIEEMKELSALTQEPVCLRIERI